MATKDPYEVMHGQELIDQLEDLIQLDFDAMKTYEHALERVDDSAVRDDLELFRLDHQRHINDLNRVIVALGGKAIDPHRDLKGVVLEGLTTIRSVTGTLGALRAMRMNEKLTNRLYLKAAEHALAPIARIVVDQNYADERRHLEAIRAHIDRLTETDIGVPPVVHTGPFKPERPLPRRH